MASADTFTARIIGKGGHGAMPHQAIDPIVIASQIVLALQTTISRNLKPLDTGVVTVGKVSAGSAFNVIPGEAVLEGTVRAFEPHVRAMLERRCREIVEELPRAFGATGEFFYKSDYPPTVNNPSVVEDMSLVLREVPGCYFFVGGRNESIGAIYPHHHPKFNIDERALFIGAQAMVEAVKECLKS
jgi:amidohydrolase